MHESFSYGQIGYRSQERKKEERNKKVCDYNEPLSPAAIFGLGARLYLDCRFGPKFCRFVD